MRHFIRVYFLLIIGVICAIFSNLNLLNNANFVYAEQIVLMPKEFVTGTVVSTGTLYYLQQKTATSYQLFDLQSKQGKLNNTSTLSLQFFGDIMLERNVAKAMGAKGLKYVFANVVSSSVGAKGLSPLLLGAADITVANLEGPFAPKRVSTSKSIAFRFDPKYAAELKVFGFDIFNLANNHLNDMGRANVVYTKKMLSANNIGYFGDELSISSDFTYVTNSIAFVGINSTYYAANLKKLEAVISNAKQKARFIVVNVHWGIEYQKKSSLTQRNLAHWLIDHGVDIIIGHHPHVTQEMEIYNGKPIFYSLGNFIFDQYFSKDTQEGLSIGLILQDDKLVSLHLFPIYSVKSQVFVMDGVRRAEWLAQFQKSSHLNGKSFELGIMKF